ncbi:MAG TPA: hypothetical protein PLD25_10575 [Chloroflexota bacterium]|nr:hypothetical protein [Chloroflexota bacterium]HUM67533.1 hypothetical protein [Chloroflexota bacterium]
MSAEVYCKLIEQTGAGCYYLWGPIQSALLIEIAEGNVDLIADITLLGGLTEEGKMPQMRQEMMVQLLCTASQEHYTRVSDLLRQLISVNALRGQTISTQQKIEAKKVAALVAGQSGIEAILLTLLEDRNEEVRRVTVEATFYLWQKERSAGYTVGNAKGIAIVRSLGNSDRISRWLLPSRRRLQSCLELSLSLLFAEYDDEQVVAFLRDTWTKIVKKLLWYETDHQATTGRHLQLIRTLLLKLVVNSGVLFAKSIEDNEKLSIYDIQALDGFFRSSAKTKALFSQLAPYICSTYGSITEIRAELMTLALSRDLMLNYLLVAILGAQIAARPAETLEIIEDIFSKVITVKPGLPSLPMLIITLSSSFGGLDRDTIDPRALLLQSTIIKEFQIQHDSLCEIYRKSNVLERIRYKETNHTLRFIYSGLSSHPQWNKEKYGSVNAHGILDVFIDNMRDGHYYDLAKIHRYVVNVTAPRHKKYRDHNNAILDSLDPIFKLWLMGEIDPKEIIKAVTLFQEYGLKNGHGFFEKEQSISRETKEYVVIEEELIRSLAKIKNYASDEVEDYMVNRQLKAEFKRRVSNRSEEEALASAVRGNGIIFVRDEVLLKPDGLLNKLFVDWFRQAPYCKSITQWISIAFMSAINALCDEPLFLIRLPQDTA